MLAVPFSSSTEATVAVTAAAGSLNADGFESGGKEIHLYTLVPVRDTRDQLEFHNKYFFHFKSWYTIHAWFYFGAGGTPKVRVTVRRTERAHSHAQCACSDMHVHSTRLIISFRTPSFVVSVRCSVASCNQKFSRRNDGVCKSQRVHHAPFCGPTFGSQRWWGQPR